MSRRAAHHKRRLKAKWILPVCRPPISGGWIEIEHKLIGAVSAGEGENNAPDGLSTGGDKLASFEQEDFGEALIVPGLINLHTHLDYSLLRGFDATADMFTWLRGLVAAAAPWSPQMWSRSSFYGAKAAALSGTSLVVDNSFSGMSALAIAQLGLRAVIGLELFGLRNDESAVAWMNWRNKYDALTSVQNEALEAALREELIEVTVAPHAPYTVCPNLWLKAQQWAEDNDLPLLAHLSESQAECRWIASKDDAVDAHLNFVRSLRATAGSTNQTIPELDKINWKGKGLSPVRHLRQHGLLSPRLLAAHCTQLDEQEVELLVHDGVKAAHCPRSNARLRNGLAPLPFFLKSQLTFGLGTDSLASCDDLNLLNEARFAVGAHRAAHPEIDWNSARILRSLTLDAAKSIGMEHRLGSLEPGKAADIAIFSLDEAASQSDRDPADLLLHAGTRLHTLIVDGDTVVSRGELVSNEERYAMTCF